MGEVRCAMTIYDIAKEAGVSASTVSRVVNKKPGVHPATKEKIELLLQKYNYSPNETARGLVMQSNRMIGILIADIRNIHYTDGVYTVEREFVRRGYCCIIFNIGSETEEKGDYIRVLGQRRVEGVVLIGSNFQTKEVEEAISQYLPETPVVIVNGYLELPNVYGVLADERSGISNLVNILFEKGHTNLVFVNSYYTPSGSYKLGGFKEGLRRQGVDKSPVIYDTTASLEGAYEVTERLMKEHPETDGIIYSIDLLAAGGGRALMDMGYSIPDQVAYTGVDNSIYTEISTPKITSLDNKLPELSQMAARLLLDALEERKVTKKMLLFSTVVERETT